MLNRYYANICKDDTLYSEKDLIFIQNSGHSCFLSRTNCVETANIKKSLNNTTSKFYPKKAKADCT